MVESHAGWHRQCVWIDSDSHMAVCRKSKARNVEGDSCPKTHCLFLDCGVSRSDPLHWRTQQEAPSSPSLEQLPRLFRQKSHNTAIEMEKMHLSMKNSIFSISVALKQTNKQKKTQTYCVQVTFDVDSAGISLCSPRDGSLPAAPRMIPALSRN